MKTKWYGLVRVETGCLVSLFLLALFGCGGLPSEIEKEINHSPQDFILGPEDVLEVTVWRNEDLSRVVVVRPDGMVSLPLIGEVQARGLTTDELAERLTTNFRQFKENPLVSVGMKEVNSYNIYVLGEVTKPGKYQLKAYTTVLQAIALAGGFTPFASKNGMQVVRIGPNGEGKAKELRIPANYGEILSGKGKVGNFVLKSGDVVVVP